MEVIKLLLRYSADITVQNDSDETVLDIASQRIKRIIIGVSYEWEEFQDGRVNMNLCFFPESIYHEDRAMSNAQALLQSAWLGDAVSVKRSLDVSLF